MATIMPEGERSASVLASVLLKPTTESLGFGSGAIGPWCGTTSMTNVRGVRPLILNSSCRRCTGTCCPLNSTVRSEAG